MTGLRPTSVRARATLTAAAVVALTLCAGSVGLLVTLEHSLTSSQDHVSRTLADGLARAAARGDLPPRVTDVGDDVVAQVVDDRNRVLAATSGLTGAGPISALNPPDDQPQLVTLHGVPDDSGAENYRVWALSQPVSDGHVRVYVGSSLESVSEAVGTLRTSLLIGLPVVLLLLALATRSLVGRALQPVEGIRVEVAEISDQRLDRRVRVPPTGDEVSRLAQTMNEMLDRLQSASDRQRDFVADASHELQSPLAAFRAQLEVAAAHPDATHWPVLVRELLVDSDRMERLVRDLLFLARDDAGLSAPPTTPVDLDVVVLEEVRRLRTSSALRFDTQGISAAPTTGARDDLGRLVRNLLENAAAHARSHVTVATSASADTVELLVCDDGPGVPQNKRAEVFDRFVQIALARGRDDARGSGLGLPIALLIARRHGGTIVLDSAGSAPGPGARVVVTLPLLDRHRPPDQPGQESPAISATGSVSGSR